MVNNAWNSAVDVEDLINPFGLDTLTNDVFMFYVNGLLYDMRCEMNVAEVTRYIIKHEFG